MQIFDYENSNSQQILALGPESNGNFAFFHQNKLYFSEDFGDLLEDANYHKFKNELNKFLKKDNFRPNVIITDLHPIYQTTILGQELAEKYKARHIQIQHHLAHIFSAIGDYKINTDDCHIDCNKVFYGVALDGTGYGLDGKIWGGEVFEISNQDQNSKLQTQRVGHLENQTMIGGELAIKEPARMLIGILSKIQNSKLQKTNKLQIQNIKSQKDFVYSFVKKYYSAQEFEVLYSQLQQDFNCIETSSTGRVLDAVSLLLDFCGNARKYKHEPIELLEKNSSKPYDSLKPIIHNNILMTTPLFEYLIKNLHKDKTRLATTAQLYIAEGLYKLICHSGLEPESSHKTKNCGLDSHFHENDIFLAGGITNNKIISEYLIFKGAYANKKVPRGDAGLSFGQIIYYLSFDQNHFNKKTALCSF